MLAANPFRYRGYYYDTESGLYYLNSRYYDPATGRFLNEDAVSYLEPEDLGGLNLYAYCYNNPVMGYDPSGRFFVTLSVLASIGIAALVGAAFGGLGTLIGDITNYCFTGQWEWSSWETYLGSALGGAVGGIVSLFLSPAAAGAIGGGISTFLGNAFEKSTGRNDRSWKTILINTAFSAGMGFVLGRFSEGLKIDGVTSGSHSWQQIAKSGLTKAMKYGFSMSAKTLMKEAGYLSVSNLSSDFLINNTLISFAVYPFIDDICRMFM